MRNILNLFSSSLSLDDDAVFLFFADFGTNSSPSSCVRSTTASFLPPSTTVGVFIAAFRRRFLSGVVGGVF